MRPTIPQSLSRDARLLLSIGVIGGFFGTALGFILQLYLKSIGFDSRAIGLLSMTNIVSMAVSSIPIGFLGDSLGRRNIMIMGCLIYLPGWYLLLSTRSLTPLTISFALQGVGNSTFTVLIFPLYASYFDEGEMEAAFGLLNFLNTISAAAGNLLGLAPPLMARLYGVGLARAYWILLTISVLSLSSILPLLFLIKSDRPKRGFSPLEFRIRSREPLIKFSILRGIIGFGAGMFISLIPYYLSVKFNVESDLIGVTLSATFVISSIATLYAARISNALGIYRGVLYSLMAVIPLYLGVVLSPLYPLTATLYVLRMGFMSIFTTLTTSLMMKIVEEGERGVVNSVVSLIESLLRGVGSAIGGDLMVLNLNLPGLISVAIYTSAIITFHTLFRGMEDARLREDQL